jgi:hypothetical protein
MIYQKILRQKHKTVLKWENNYSIGIFLDKSYRETN